LEAQLTSARDQLEAVSRQLESSQRELAGLKDQRAARTGESKLDKAGFGAEESGNSAAKAP
jgi:hypothetical protein